MNYFKQLQYKTRVGMLLAGLIIFILLNNIMGRHSFTNVQNSVAAIYNDRLMPATYIFEITDHLYQKRLLQEGVTGPETEALLQQHSQAIATLIQKYETTHLTPYEQQHWAAFKAHLLAYNKDAAATGRHQSAVAAKFDETIKSLNVLSGIQTGEAEHLRLDTTAVLSTSSLRSSLEIIAVLVIGSITVVLIGASEKIFKPDFPHRTSLN